jgi:hypothetical protein
MFSLNRRCVINREKSDCKLLRGELVLLILLAWGFIA